MINVIGMGYIGLPTAVMLACAGNEVVGTDINDELIMKLNGGILSFKEDQFEAYYNMAIKKGLRFSNKYHEADVYIVAVPTPYLKNERKIDPSFVITAVKEVVLHCKRSSIIVLESTISPGTVDKHIRPLIPEGVEIVHAPERIIPGNMINEIKNNARIIGADNVEVGNRIKMIYKTFCDGEISITDIKTAEMIKVAENTYRDINIAYANELTKICESAGLDVYRVIALANKHPRVNILTPGPGVGGHCISVDPWFLVGDYPGLANLILTARKINDSMPEYVLKRIADIMDENNIANLDEIGLYGLTYKENVDDIRESPTLQLLQCMRDHLAKGIKVYDPMIKKRVVDCQVMSFDDFLDASSMIVIMVGHEEIIRCSNRLRGKIVLDTRNVINGNGIYRL